MSINPHPMDQSELPEIITSYLRAHKARDLDAAIACYTIDARVTDEGSTYNGPQEIGDWLSRSASEFRYTIEAIGTTKIDNDHFDVLHHLEGNFPGGNVDLHFRFVLREGKIAQLVIEE